MLDCLSTRQYDRGDFSLQLTSKLRVMVQWCDFSVCSWSFQGMLLSNTLHYDMGAWSGPKLLELPGTIGEE